VSDIAPGGDGPDKSPIRVLIIDDDEELARALGRVLSIDHFASHLNTDPSAALQEIAGDPDAIDAILLDVNMPQMSGLEVLARLREDARSPAVIMLTADNVAATAAAAMRGGAFHYLTKPVRPVELTAVVEAAARYTQLQRRSRQLEQTVAATSGGVQLVGRAAEMRRVLASIEKLAQTDVGLLVLGESGTGKEVVARAIHQASPRRARPFVALNCGAIPETLIDSELFGHTKGAFTGAASARPGVFVEADGGTLFLDEIGDMPLGVQARLLRVLQDHEVRAVGGQGSRPIDVRVIAATHVDLQGAVDGGQFRTDLFYRLNVVTLTIPPLRDRKDDLPLLIAHFLDKHGGATPPRLSAAAFEALVDYAWPGNVRELENSILGALALRQGDLIEVAALPRRIVEAARPPATAPPVPDIEEPLADAKRKAMVDFERDYLRKVLDQTHGNVAEAARRTGVDRSNFRRLLHRHGIDPESFRPPS
jgi:two-component system, NtrC family, response regulator AtoC